MLDVRTGSPLTLADPRVMDPPERPRSLLAQPSAPPSPLLRRQASQPAPDARNAKSPTQSPPLPGVLPQTPASASGQTRSLTGTPGITPPQTPPPYRGPQAAASGQASPTMPTYPSPPQHQSPYVARDRPAIASSPLRDTLSRTGLADPPSPGAGQHSPGLSFGPSHPSVNVSEERRLSDPHPLRAQSHPDRAAQLEALVKDFDRVMAQASVPPSPRLSPVQTPTSAGPRTHGGSPALPPAFPSPLSPSSQAGLPRSPVSASPLRSQLSVLLGSLEDLSLDGPESSV